ncbi:MAG TPA: glycoside hydrolase family 15 protein, partial [bacterium]|nr:glycoside hydrolase family 15 protein [bacterium]
IRIQSTVPLQAEGSSVWSEFELVSGGQATFVIGEADHNGKPFPMDENFLKKMLFDTIRFWKEWIGRSQYQGRWREMVNRSALTLKLLTFQPLGSMVAAPTFGLPEEIGGERNWDYRYTWIRDASFAIGAFMRLGYTDEAGDFMKWVQKRCGEPLPDGSLQIMFGLDGQKSLEEEILPDWEGYRGSKPVRIGNLAHHQTQIDIYGELMDAVYRYDELGKSISRDFWQDLVRLMDWVCANWQNKGDGIWESRGGPQEFLHNRVMCWVALDRAIRLARNRAHPAPLARWEETRDHIYVDIFSNFWDEKRGTFVQRKGSLTVDASSLLMPLLKFIGPTDPRWLSTLAAIEQDLLDDSLVYRYRNDGNDHDGLKGSEGTFTMCSFWYVECLSRAGRLDEAQFLFEKLMGYANHVGLYSEELSQKGEHLGNFPQAFTHIALIRAAFDLNDRLNTRVAL